MLFQFKTACVTLQHFVIGDTLSWGPDHKGSIVGRVYDESLRIGDDGTIYETVYGDCLSCKKGLIALLEIKDLKLISLTKIELDPEA